MKSRPNEYLAIISILINAQFLDLQTCHLIKRSHKGVFPDTRHWPIFPIRHPTQRLKIGRHQHSKSARHSTLHFNRSKSTLDTLISKSTCDIAKYLTLTLDTLTPLYRPYKMSCQYYFSKLLLSETEFLTSNHTVPGLTTLREQFTFREATLTTGWGTAKLGKIQGRNFVIPPIERAWNFAIPPF